MTTFWLLEQGQVVGKANAITMARRGVLLELDLVSADRIRRAVLVGGNLGVTLIVHLKLVIFLDIRRELHTVGDLAQLLNGKGKVRVGHRHVQLLRAVVALDLPVGERIIIDLTKQADLALAVRACVEAEARVRLEAHLVVNDWRRDVQKAEIVTHDIVATIDLFRNVVCVAHEGLLERQLLVSAAKHACLKVLAHILDEVVELLVIELV